MNKIYGIVFGQCTLGLQSEMKEVTDYGKKSNDCDVLWLMGELNKITAGLDTKENPRMSLIDQLISFVTMRQYLAETNDESLELDLGTAFDKFREKLKGYVEIKFDNKKNVLCVVTDMEDPTKTFEEDNMSEYLD